ncbi:MAG: glutaredoxin [Sphingomonas sp.]|nr:glutaredoxin [Sphingomonas sp.]
MAAATDKSAILYRMVMPAHVCPWGLKAKHLLESRGFKVDDRHLTTHEETEAFKAKHKVKTTPQTFIHGERVGGYEDLKRYFGRRVRAKGETSYVPVIALFLLTALAALALSIANFGTPVTVRSAEWFIGLSMVVLAFLKLQDVESFSAMFLNYDLLSRRWVPYASLYPTLEAVAGLLMLADRLHWLSVPIALFIGIEGAVSVFKAVYVDKRELKCACVGGSSNVPLGFVSLTENLMMVAMALWMSRMWL